MNDDALACPVPCPEWCVRSAGHGLYVAGRREWERIHTGEATETAAGPVYLEQHDTVTAGGGTVAGPQRMSSEHGSLVMRPRLRVVA